MNNAFIEVCVRILLIQFDDSVEIVNRFLILAEGGVCSAPQEEPISIR